MVNMTKTDIGMTLLLIVLLYFVFLSVKSILIGKGKNGTRGYLIAGIIGISVAIPFLCFIVYLFFQVNVFQ